MKKAPKTLFGKQIRNNKKAHKLMIGLNMVGLSVNMHACELILRAQHAMAKKKGKFDLKTASKIQVEVEELFAKMKEDFENRK